uniref:Uncharacterized protein n=1 Tax=Sipha flava TaxID=143950 RepID=A0A2S2QEL1_9HEMI
MDMSINKIVGFGTTPIYTKNTKIKCISRKPLFGTDSGIIIILYLFQNETNIAITVYGKCYRFIIRNFLLDGVKLDDIDTENIPTGRCYVSYSACNNVHFT